MIEEGEVHPEGCICEPRSDISPNWKDIRTKFGYTTLGGMLLGVRGHDEEQTISNLG